MLGHIVDYFRARTRLGEKLLILLDNLDEHLSKWNELAQLMQSHVLHNYKLLGTVQKLLVTRTPYKCPAAKKKIAGIAGYVKIF
ncbi:MAG: hypothetical protein K2N34_03725 [Lachnospiraceae bacterium]|nr:hypothetical protein [Lachnospiraceae bacterium]